MNVQLNSLSDLAWAHFWQVTAVVLCVAVLVRLLGRTRPHLAYLLWLLVFVKCVTPPIWSCPTGVFSWLNAREVAPPPELDRNRQPSPPVADATAEIRPAEGIVGRDVGAEAHAVEPATRPGHRIETTSLFIVAWLVGVFVFLGVLTRRTLCWRSALRRSTVASDNALNSLVTELCRQLAVKRQVRIRITREPLGPAVIGVFRPTILLPEVVLAKASMSQIEPIVAHELVHIRRRDNAVGLLQSIAQLLWWFHPMVWWANRTACAERERCCDEEVVACLGRGPEWYAQGLLDFLKLKRELSPLFAVSGISPYEVTRSRLEDIMRSGKTFHQRMPRRYWLVFLVAMLLLGPGRGLLLTGAAGGTGDARESQTPAGNDAATPAPAAEKSAVPSASTQKGSGIEGTWLATSVQQGGRRLVGDSDQKFLMLVRDKTLTLRVGGKIVAETSYSLEPDREPSAVDLALNGESTLGIYQREGDGLMICLNNGNKGRPTEFVAGNDAADLLIQFKRLTVEEEPLSTINANGTGLRKLLAVPDYSSIGSPDWSRDGTRIAFDAWRSSIGETYVDGHVFVVNADGGKPIDLGPGAMPSWSPDGTRVAFCQYSPNQGVWIMGADGTGRQLLNSAAWGAEWCPTGDRVAYVTYQGGANVTVHELGTGRRQTLFDKGYSRIDQGMAWSPDGQWICFKGITADRTAEMAAVHVDGQAAGFKVLLPKAMPGVQDILLTFAWSGDGKHILASLIGPGKNQRQLYFVDVEGRSAPRLVPGQDQTRWNNDMAWSLDGKRIVFCSQEIPAS